MDVNIRSSVFHIPQYIENKSTKPVYCLTTSWPWNNGEENQTSGGTKQVILENRREKNQY
jgi:hypothetical protein